MNKPHYNDQQTVKLAAKLWLLLVGLTLAPCALAHYHPNYCSKINGLWVGHYHDTMGLFSQQDFPIKLYLTTDQDNDVIGYTMHTNDQNGAQYGTDKVKLFNAKCSHNQLSNMTLVPSHSCGDRTQKKAFIYSSHSLHFPLHWENAMTSTDFTVTLTKSNKIPQKTNKYWIHEAKVMAHQKLPSCH